MLGKGVARTQALEALIILFLRGLSVRDVEELLKEALGEHVVWKSTVARICQDTSERYRAGCQRDLTSTTSSTAKEGETRPRTTRLMSLATTPGFA